MLLGAENIKDWLDQGLNTKKIHDLLAHPGVQVPYRTLARFAVERCGARCKTVTVAVHSEDKEGAAPPGSTPSAFTPSTASWTARRSLRAKRSWEFAGRATPAPTPPKTTKKSSAWR